MEEKGGSPRAPAPPPRSAPRPGSSHRSPDCAEAERRKVFPELSFSILQQPRASAGELPFLRKREVQRGGVGAVGGRGWGGAGAVKGPGGRGEAAAVRAPDVRSGLRSQLLPGRAHALPLWRSRASGGEGPGAFPRTGSQRVRGPLHQLRVGRTSRPASGKGCGAPGVPAGR